MVAECLIRLDITDESARSSSEWIIHILGHVKEGIPFRCVPHRWFCGRLPGYNFGPPGLAEVRTH